MPEENLKSMEKNLPENVMSALKALKMNGTPFLEVPIEQRVWNAGTHAAMLARLAHGHFDGAEGAEQQEAARVALRDELHNCTCVCEQANFKKKLIGLGLMPAEKMKAPIGAD
jgi:hypothetical protein